MDTFAFDSLFLGVVARNLILVVWDGSTRRRTRRFGRVSLEIFKGQFSSESWWDRLALLELMLKRDINRLHRRLDQLLMWWVYHPVTEIG